MTGRWLLLSVSMWVLGCSGGQGAAIAPTVGERAASTKAPEPLAPEQVAKAVPQPPAPAVERTFGAPLQGQAPVLSVASVLATPEQYVGKLLRVEGTVARVCERAGCWLELSTAAGQPGLRVPMAGHAFFIPQDALGRPAVVEGQLRSAPLPESQRAHLAGEGAVALGPLALDATSVVVR